MNFKNPISNKSFDPLSNKLHTQLCRTLFEHPQLEDQLADQLYWQLYDQLSRQLYDQLYNQLNSQLYNELQKSNKN